MQAQCDLLSATATSQCQLHRSIEIDAPLLVVRLPCDCRVSSANFEQLRVGLSCMAAIHDATMKVSIGLILVGQVAFP